MTDWTDDIKKKFTGCLQDTWVRPKGRTGPKPRLAQDAYDYVMSKAVRLENGCLNYTITRPVAYGYRVICVEAKQWYVHRLVYFITYGFLPEVVRHKCHLTTCIEPTHLMSGTHADNVADCVAAQRHAFGRKNRQAVLTEKQVREIRASTDNLGVLSRRYGISRGGILHVRNGVTWKHVK